MVKGWGIDLLMAFDVQAPVVWILVLNSPNLWHVGVFAVLTTGLLIAVPGRPHLCVHLAMLLGVFLELAQIFVPGREAGLADLVYNLAGVSASFFGFVAFQRLRFRWVRRKVIKCLSFKWLRDTQKKVIKF